MNDFMNPNVQDRPFSFVSYSEARENPHIPQMYNNAPPPVPAQQQEAQQINLNSLCSSSQKPQTTVPAPNYEWLPPDTTTIGAFKRLSKQSDGAPFDDSRSLWENSYTPIDGTNPQSSGLWGYTNTTCSHPVNMKDRMCDTPSTSRNCQATFNYLSNLGFGYNDGVLMSPGSKDMAALGLQMADQVLSNSPSNGCKIALTN